MHQLECIFVFLAYVITVMQAFKIEFEVKHFLIVLIVIKWHNRDSVVELKCERVHWIVHKHNILKMPLLENSKIFDVIVRVAGPNTTRAVKSSLYKSAGRINVIYYWVCILLFWRCEYNHLKILICSFQAFTDMRSYVNTCHHRFRILRKFYGDYNIRVIVIHVIYTMNKRLIKIENDSFCL